MRNWLQGSHKLNLNFVFYLITQSYNNNDDNDFYVFNNNNDLHVTQYICKNLEITRTRFNFCAT